MFEGLFQPTHLLVIFGIALLVFGPKKLPELGKGIGEGIRGFKSAMKEEEKPANTRTIIAGDQSWPGESWVLARSCCSQVRSDSRCSAPSGCTSCWHTWRAG